MVSKSFKTDESFLEKISIGAIGTRKVYQDLIKNNHEPIELERGSMNFKIWKEIKIKRIRVPDLLCVKCGKRFESRAKTKLEITMSHSTSIPERAWDNGLKDQDYVALVVCEKAGEEPIDWLAEDLIQYISVKDLRSNFEKGRVKQEKPKGATEGYETRITWPSKVASSDGFVSNLNSERLQYKRIADNRTISLSLLSNGCKLSPLINIDQQFTKNEIIASVVSVFKHVDCTSKLKLEEYINLIRNVSISERYAAVKAISYFDFSSFKDTLINILNNEDEHIYIKLEAAATLMRAGHLEGNSFVEKCLQDRYLQHRLEAIIILGEIHSKDSSDLLSKCLIDVNQNAEIRSGAAWALGELGFKDNIQPIIKSFLDVGEKIKIEAARALAKLARKYTDDIIEYIPLVDQRQRSGIAWALGKAGGFSIKGLLPSCIDEDTRHWISYIIGVQNPQKYLLEIEQVKETDSEVYFAINLLWKILANWIYDLKEY